MKKLKIFGLEIDLVYEWEKGSMLILIGLGYIVHHP